MNVLEMRACERYHVHVYIIVYTIGYTNMAAVTKFIAKNNKTTIHQPVKQRDVFVTHCKINR